MKVEYDFSKGERDKFCNSRAEFNLPIYLEPDVAEFIKQIAEQRKTDMSGIANSLLKRNMELIADLQGTSKEKA